MNLAPQVIAALVGVVGVAFTLLVHRLLLNTTRRHETDAVITAVRSDISSIVYTVDQINLVRSFIFAFQAPPDAPVYPPWVDSPRSENYFQLFGAIAPQLGRMPSGLAEQVVRFYTFMRVARDAATPLSSLKQSQAIPRFWHFHTMRISQDDQHVEHLRNVLFALSQSFQAAAVVLSATYSPTRCADKSMEIAKKLTAAIAEAIN